MNRANSKWGQMESLGKSSHSHFTPPASFSSQIEMNDVSSSSYLANWASVRGLDVGELQHNREILISTSNAPFFHHIPDIFLSSLVSTL